MVATVQRLEGLGKSSASPPEDDGKLDRTTLRPEDIEDRQKKIQEFVAKNNEDFAKKLKEEQDKAKAAN